MPAGSARARFRHTSIMSCCVGKVSSMEIPVPLSVLPPFSSLLEDDVDSDVPPSPTLDPPTPNTLTSGLFFQQGFLDCAQQALTFLTEKEGMPNDNSVVVGLKDHLVWSSQQFTPASLAPPPPTSSSSVFTFPPPASQPLVSKSSKSPSKSESNSVRYAPYSVADSSRRRHPVADRPAAAVTYSSTRNFERVLRDNVISTDDLHGVLRCLQYSEASACETTTAVDSINSRIHLPPVFNNSLNDSGLSEAGSVDLADEVDGCENCDEDNLENDVFENMRSGFQNVDSPSHFDTDIATVTEFSDVAQESEQTQEDSETEDFVSSPSSQLSLLTSLSSGTHRLTSTNGNVTASRIQSLASEILLLLQEEAEASDSEDDDEEDYETDDDDDDDDDDENEIVEDVENEP